jgi:protein subunit release factor A
LVKPWALAPEFSDRGRVSLFLKINKKENMSIIVEIHAAEGGDDAKQLVEEQFMIYCRLANKKTQECL